MKPPARASASPDGTLSMARMEPGSATSEASSFALVRRKSWTIMAGATLTGRFRPSAGRLGHGDRAQDPAGEDFRQMLVGLWEILSVSWLTKNAM